MTEPAIILVESQLAENIGMSARAMLNCGLTDLRLVRPREEWPNERAMATASGATAVIEKARVYDSTEAAVADLSHVYATTGRMREMVKPIYTARSAALEMRAHAKAEIPFGILFGPERTGLVNDDLTLADRLIRIPLNPDYCSLNLAQAVLLCGYEWFTAADATAARELPLGQSRPATKGELLNLIHRMETALEPTGFYTSPEIRPAMQRNIRNAFERAEMTDQEIRTLHGVVTALIQGPREAPVRRTKAD